MPAVPADERTPTTETRHTTDEAADRFRAAVEDRCPGLLPERDVPLLHASLLRLLDGGDDHAGRSALLRALGSAYRSFGLRSWHAAAIGAALLASPGVRWRRAWRLVERTAARVGDGPAWWAAEVIGHDRDVDGVAALTVRPWRRLPFRAGQAVPVCTPRRPGRWRWLSPANAPRANGTVEFHVRALAGGSVSGGLVHEVRPGELLHLGPPTDSGLELVDGADDVLLVAGGTGLAPLRALVEQVAATAHRRRVTLIVGSRTFADLYDAIALDMLQQAHDWLTIVPAFSADPEAEPGERGTALDLAAYHHRPEQHVYVCGPPAMLAAARRWLPIAGVPADRLHLPTLGCR
ncbi:FAD-binding oxidoreductase [Micromonospora sp. WMMD975]|uniref:FAD-binding oxidoreductase n=1 Tax=Micromonospora sp. WMMD975 TaxID=3016087 RepID=UPI00249B5C97|nr:FAD-binding oxidoreductase [Micromonospora sp. WMMD975]WFE33947.1 FAD-binding oxidoreductase [Micromonospora sp. WMMD975]